MKIKGFFSIPLYIYSFKVSFISFVTKPPLFMRTKWQNMTTFFAVIATYLTLVAIYDILFVEMQRCVYE